MLENILPSSIYNDIFLCENMDKICEIRIRKGMPIWYSVDGKYKKLTRNGQAYFASQDDIDQVVLTACEHSIYAQDEAISQGYITTKDGCRIGICGQGVVQNGRFRTVKNISSICIRIGKNIKFCNRLLDKIVRDFDSTLICSPPGLGKTTLLRYMVKRLSDSGQNILLIDEREEIVGGGNDGWCDVGECTDIARGIPKNQAYRYFIRSMRPDVVATDEIFGEDEICAIVDCVRCGVKVLATVHSGNIGNLIEDRYYKKLCECFRYFVEIENIGKIGRVFDKEMKGG